MPSKKAATPYDDLSAYDENGTINAIIETPKGSRNKFDFDAGRGLFKLGGVLTAGAVFPYDFGFVPATLGEDGDPIDVLVLMDEPAFAGCLVASRLIGAVTAEQTERDGETVRNDRLIAVAEKSHLYGEARELDELSGGLLDEIEHFFASYNLIKGKNFQPLQRLDAEGAARLIEDGQKRLAGKTKRRATTKNAAKVESSSDAVAKARSDSTQSDAATTSAQPTSDLAGSTSPAAASSSSPQSSYAAAFYPTRLWCDGACSGNPGPGGWGCIVEIDGARHEYSGGRARTTNNQMELQALIEGLKSLPSGTRVQIVTDSEYLTKGISSWLKGWIRNGWKTASKQPVKNQEQWQQLNDLLQARPHRVEWVRGHAGHAENERCDELARMAIRRNS